MATKIQFRRDTAANWTSVNPILSQGELGLEIDTDQFKIGDGSTAWASLAYGGLQGPAQTDQIVIYGDGSDGDVTLTSGTTTLTRDMYYNNLTISGTAVLNTSNFRIFVKGILDISAAPSGSIANNGGNGGNSATTGAGAAGSSAVP